MEFSKIPKELAALDDYLSRVIRYSYKNTMLISNPVISRNPFSSSLIGRVLGQGFSSENQKTKARLFCNLLMHYFKSFVLFVFFIFHFLAFKASKLRFKRDGIRENERLFVVSTFTMIDKIYPKGRFIDPYFGSLYEIMEKRKRQYVILCMLIGDKPWNLRRRVQTYNILANDGRIFVTEFDLMGIREWIDLLKFTLFYPLATLQLTQKAFGEFDDLLRDEIIQTLDIIEFPNYVRYLVGRKLSSLNHRRLDVISWYENHVTDKLLLRGLRESGVTSKTYGCQFFDKPPLWRSLYPLGEEAKQGVLPDVILVSGRYYLNENTDLNIKLGISPRYDYLFDVNLNKRNILERNGLLVLLVYDTVESREIIRLVEKGLDGQGHEVTIKLHPNHLLLKPFRYPKTWKYSEENLSKLCLRSSIAITGGSSSALEAAVMGCSVIVMNHAHGLTLNPMPEYGKGKIWDKVSDSDQLNQTMFRLNQFRHENPEEMVILAQEFRDMFFTEATKGKYVELFDL